MAITNETIPAFGATRSSQAQNQADQPSSPVVRLAGLSRFSIPATASIICRSLTRPMEPSTEPRQRDPRLPGARPASPFHEVGRQRIMAEPGMAWRIAESGRSPRRPRGRRMAAPYHLHVRWCSSSGSGACRIATGPTFGLTPVPGDVVYLCAARGCFLRRPLRRNFLSLPDPGHGLFDLPRPGAASPTLLRARTAFCVVSFASDWLFRRSRTAVVQGVDAAAAASVVELKPSRPWPSSSNRGLVCDHPRILSSAARARAGRATSVDASSR